MNLSKEQSEYVVTLKPGMAAVFTDGMDHPVLAQILGGEEREDAVLAVREPPLAGRRSRACGSECRDGSPCTLVQLRHAETFLDRIPELTLWMELSCAAHILGLRAPGFVSTYGVEEVRELAVHDARLIQCVVAHSVERVIGGRYEVLKDFYDPESLGEHLASGLILAINSEGAPDVCAKDEGRWRAGRYRYADILALMKEPGETNDSSRVEREDVVGMARERGLDLRGAMADSQLVFLQSFPNRYPGLRQSRLLVGDADPPVLLPAAEKLVGPGENTKVLMAAGQRVLIWRQASNLKTLVGQLSKAIGAQP